MSKLKTIYICQNCGSKYSKWLGQCVSCKEWNTIHEEIVDSSSKKEQFKNNWNTSNNKNKPVSLDQIKAHDYKRISTNNQEIDRVLGGGIVSGSVVLVGGHPGIGKSTLLLQIALNTELKILYVSGEENEEQIKLRANRLKSVNKNLFIYSETSTLEILKQAKLMNVDFIIIDSIQTLVSPGVESVQGSVTQVRESTTDLQKFAKQSGVSIFIIGHINKDGAIAGPKILEHIVDTVLQFEGDYKYHFRILRSKKNRFGSTDELGIFKMKEEGLESVSNPSSLFLNESFSELSGTAIATTIEGGRPIMVETQALVSSAVYGNPQRSATGFDTRRMNMLLAVLEKRCGLRFGQEDVFLNIAGGIKIADPALDLSICAALVSSLQDIMIKRQMCFAGEIGLSGEIRAISHIEQRIQEASRLGFTDIYISYAHVAAVKGFEKIIDIHPIKILPDLFESLFG